MDKYIFRKRKFLNKSYCKRVIDWFDNDLSVVINSCEEYYK